VVVAPEIGNGRREWFMLVVVSGGSEDGSQPLVAAAEFGWMVHQPASIKLIFPFAGLGIDLGGALILEGNDEVCRWVTAGEDDRPEGCAGGDGYGRVK
jgi:hypothetical protein